MDNRITPIKQIQECILKKQNFILQGGAGSGKTETLKHVLEFISKNMPDKKIACITHTNLAVDEIVLRVGNQYTISTIHSFLNSLIKNYKKNIHAVIFEIFKIEKIERKNINCYEDEKSQKKIEHDKYKKIYKKYAKKAYDLKKETTPKVIGKREYDKNPLNLNLILNENIANLNYEISELIKKKDFNKIRYNETRYDSLKDLTFGHDSLLKLSALLFDKYDLLNRIVQDKYDFIFIDEYQDTNEQIIDLFLNKMTSGKTTIGLFGDSMQGIYENGIGDVENYIQKKILFKIEKEDNFRCSEQVTNFIKHLRNDELNQKVALKINNGIQECLSDRQGFIKLYYSLYSDKKPHSKSPQEEKEKYTFSILSLLKKVDGIHPGFKKLMLTNKSISREVGFNNLFDIFNKRFNDVKEEIEKDLERLQFIDLVELYLAYTSEEKNYNFILTRLKKAGFNFKSIKDKIKVKESFDQLLKSNKNATEILEFAFQAKLLKKSNSYITFMDRKDLFMEKLEENKEFQQFKNKFNSGYNTFTKMIPEIPTLENEEFVRFVKLLKKEIFYIELFSDKLNFKEIVSYYRYLNEEMDYITMHKTKGSGINNVMIVLDEFYWTEYNFKTLFNSSPDDSKKRLKNQKLFYVACSRAIDNLIVIKLVLNSEEEKELIAFFSDVTKVNLEK